MARSSKVDVCLICGEVPCDCTAGNKKKTPARPRATRRDVGGEAHELAEQPEAGPVQSRPSMRDKMKASAAATPSSASPRRRAPVIESPPQAPPPPDPNLVLAAALRALEPILHPEEKTRYSMIISSAPTQAERTAAWRSRVQGDA